MNKNLNPVAGNVNRGNWNRMKQVMNRAKEGEPIKIAFLGGSITQGCLATVHEKCYARLTFDWWQKTFPNSQMEYINAGIGGTTSQFGVARVDKDVLSYEPDVVFIEFSVNDQNTEFFSETYEGLIRHVYGSRTKPAVMLIHNIKYDDGATAEEIHTELGRYYHLPCVSMKSTIYAMMERGEISSRDVTEDDLHPNDVGHGYLSEVITCYLAQINEEKDILEEGFEELPNPLTKNAYEYSVRYQAKDCQPNSKGFLADTREKEYYTDIFKGGWTATEKGAEITFSLKGSGIAVQYRKTINKPAPVAVAVLDGDEENAVILDANFDETWGDSLHLDVILRHGEDKEHSLTIRIVETHEDDKSEFYLVSVITSK